jgi:hypothetical protein
MPPEPILNPHGREWKIQSDLFVDPAANAFTRRPHLNWPPLLRDKPIKSALDYFSLFYPAHSLGSMLQYTNEEMVRRRLPLVSHGEFFRALGGRLMMACQPVRGPIERYWDIGKQPGTCFVGADFG